MTTHGVLLVNKLEVSRLRDASVVMDLKRMGAMHQTRISFVRNLIRKISKSHWKFYTHKWALSLEGFGTVIYRVETPHNVYHVVIFADYIPDEERNDRVIAEKWDCTFVLVQGEVTDQLLKKLRANVPLQEAGRNPKNVLVLSRANKSVRVFDHVVDSLANGHQPDKKLLRKVGYILRTTAVYGNGKFGVLDFLALRNNEDFRDTFSAQMLAVYVLRQFSLDWVHYLAKIRGGDKAVELDRDIQRYLGTGNATGLGMSLYLIRHPRILDRWMHVRELAIAESAEKMIDAVSREKMINLLSRASLHMKQVVTINEQQRKLNRTASDELREVILYLGELSLDKQKWRTIIEFSGRFNLETQEITLSCLLELYPEIVDDYENYLNTDESFKSLMGVTVKEIIDTIENKYRWCLTIDYNKPDNSYWFWYISENKYEPRLGSRYEEDGAELELPLDISRQVSRLYDILVHEDESIGITDFLLQHPSFHDITRRVWTMGNQPMGDIQSNLIGKNLLPIDLLRAKLSLFGATKFDPRSDRWVRVTFFQNSPLMDELHEDEWQFPLL